MEDEKYLSIEEVAKRLGVGDKTIDKYIRENKLKAIKNPISGSVVGIRECDLQEFLHVKPPEPKAEIKQSGEPPELTEAKKQTTLEKEHAEQAKLQNEQHKSKIEIDLRQKGYNSIEAGLADVEAKQKEALEMMEASNRERVAIRAELEAVAREKQKALNAIAVVKERERIINEKWSDIMVKEENQKTFVGKYDTLRKELIELAEYHKTHIVPCAKALLAISKTIYTWADILNSNTGYDFIELYNYIGKAMKVIDQYTDRVPVAMSKSESEDTSSDGGGKSV